MHFILLKYIHYIIRYMCFYKNRLNLPRSPLSAQRNRAQPITVHDVSVYNRDPYTTYSVRRTLYRTSTAFLR